MRLTFFEGARGAAAHPANARVAEFASGSAFLDWIETVPSRACVDEDEKRDSPGFSLAVWRAGALSKAHSELAPDATTCVLPFDLDTMGADDLAPALACWRELGVDLVVYSTWKHTPEAPRLRLLVALDADLSTADARGYRGVYKAAAAALGITYDRQAASASNLYFLPQHKPDAGPGPRLRWRGRPLSLAALRAAAPAVEAAPDDEIGAARARPDRGELRQLAGKLRKRAATAHRDAGLALAAVVRGEPYAEPGHVYAVTQHLAFALAFEIADLDEPWFVETLLAQCWRVMWPGQSLEPIEKDWANAWRSARERHGEYVAERARERAAVRAETPEDAADAAVARARAHAGALICVHGSAYYVFDPATGAYTHPVRGQGVAARATAVLGGVPGVQITEPRDNGRPCPKSPVQLVADYGTAIDAVHYYATPPQRCFDKGGRAIAIGAYRWNAFKPVFSPICDELWRTMAGDTYQTFEAWLTKFRRLERPLPALVLVGPPGTWKSRTAQTLSRFWGEPDAPTACRAGQVLGRFSAPLLANPVVWSDEELATDERGRAIPERYRESISEIVHQIERKGIDPAALHSALRHVISVNDLDKVFSREVHGDAVRATLDRFLVVTIDGPSMEAFERRWAGTAELTALREGRPMLQHVAWLEQHRAVPDAGRFGVETHTDPDVLARAQFANDSLGLILAITTDALLEEATRSVPGDPKRCPLRVVDGVLRFAPRVVVDLWPDARATRGQRGSVPTVGAVARALDGAGFRLPGAGGPDGFPFDGARWADWLRLGEVYDRDLVAAAAARVLK